MSNSLAKLGMFACCVIMALPILAYFAAGGTLQGAMANLVVFAPLLLCAGAHLVMFKMMGKSCHGAQEDAEVETVSETIVERPTDVPTSGATARTAVGS